jgi:hypothetical protein
VIKYAAIAVGVLTVLLGVSGWLLKRAYAENGALEAKNKGLQAVVDQREKDAAENAKAVAQLAERLSATETKVITTERVIYAAPKTTVCRQQPSIGAALDGVQQLYLAPTVQAPGGRQPSVAVPGPNAPAK